MVFYRLVSLAKLKLQPLAIMMSWVIPSDFITKFFRISLVHHLPHIGKVLLVE